MPKELDDSDRELLIRIDERTQSIVTSIAGIESNYVRKDQFAPVQKIVYGAVGIVLVAVAVAGITLVMK